MYSHLFLFFSFRLQERKFASFFDDDPFRSVSSEVSSDLIVQVKGSRYLLHKVGFLFFIFS